MKRRWATIDTELQKASQRLHELLRGTPDAVHMEHAVRKTQRGYQGPVYSIVSLLPFPPNCEKLSAFTAALDGRHGITEQSFLLRHITLALPNRAFIFNATLPQYIPFHGAVLEQTHPASIFCTITRFLFRNCQAAWQATAHAVSWKCFG